MYGWDALTNYITKIGYDADGNVIDDNCVMRYENSETAGWFTIRARSTDMGGDDVLCIRRIKADDGFRCEGDSSTLSGGQQWRNVHGRVSGDL